MTKVTLLYFLFDDIFMADFEDSNGNHIGFDRVTADYLGRAKAENKLHYSQTEYGIEAKQILEHHLNS